ncbi:class I SAM-dependent methyltransferase [Christiangramia portivictoriae]|uniref:class I SAM-dependent methyltransferase n=1 Tax=Christiangramia portivictoriae TaxID=326069 RepID=UPI00041B5269|nr:class I SAM-dependent methyltransferase [Christiangramia portivictoriae]
MDEEVRSFIRENQQKDLPELILKGSPFSQISIQELATQIKGRRVAEKKFPLLFHKQRILYPPKLNLEQTSSQITAEYKASLVKGDSGADLTGGLGIDTYFLSKRFESFQYYEMNRDLSEIAAHNFKELEATNINVQHGNSIQLLKDTEQKFDCIYADPARRDERGSKVYQLSDCLPDIPEHLDFLLEKSHRILLKTSPILDIKAGLRELHSVKEIHVVAVNNEVKEVIWLIEKDWNADPELTTINFQGKKLQKFGYDTGIKTLGAVLSQPLKYLYEPNAAIMKSGLFTEISNSFKVPKLHLNSHLYTSEILRKEFPGRIFQITDIKRYSDKDLKKKLKNTKANVTTRNFPVSVENIRKKYRIQDGGSVYIFFTTNPDDEKIVIFCKKAQLA